MRLFYPWAPQLLAEVRSRLESVTELYIPPGDAPTHSAPLLTFIPAFPTTCSCWWALPCVPTLFPLLQPFPLIPLLLPHHSFLFPSILVSSLVHVMSPGTWKQQDFPGGWLWQAVSLSQAYLTDFLCQFAQQPCYAMFSDHLNDNEKRVLQAIGI